MRYCQACVLPDTRPNLVIDESGICNACRNHRTKKDIDWDARERAFRSVVADVKARARGYDCVIAVSGGKDSTWQVLKCLEHGLNPLTVTWKTPVRTDIGQRNLDNLVGLGVDHIDYQVNPEVERKLVHQTLVKYGTPAIPMHLGIFNIPLTVAVRFGIPLVVYGENPAFEYGSRHDEHTGSALDGKWIARSGITHGTTARDWVSDELTEKDLTPYFGPSDAELAGKRISAVFLGYYFQWDPETVFSLAAAHGFKARDEGARTGFYDYADIDDDFISIHHYLKWFKFGFTRLWDNLSLEIRNDRLTRDEAIRIIAERHEEAPLEDIDKHCAYLRISRERFFEIVETFRNRDIWKRRDGKWIIEEFLVPDWNWT